MQNTTQPTLKVFTSRSAALVGACVSLFLLKMTYDMWGVPPRPGSRSGGLFGDIICGAFGLAALVIPISRWRKWPHIELTTDGIVMWRLFWPQVRIDWADIDSAWIHRAGANNGRYSGWGLVVAGKWRRVDGVVAEMEPFYSAACLGMDIYRDDLADALEQRLAAFPCDETLHVPRPVEGSAYAFRWHRARAR
jgi:hypothetical protein